MRPQHILVTTFACFLSMASASFISKVQPSDSRNIRMKRETAIDSQRYKCFEELTLKTDALLAEVKSKSLMCVEAADYQKKSNSATFQEFQKIVADKMKVAQDSLEICSKKTDAEEYFECLKSFEGETRAVLDYINLKSDQYSFELAKIEHEERDCLKTAVDENRSASNFLDLRQCIIESPDSIPAPQQEERVNENLQKLQNIYATLRTCTKNDEDGNGFHKCWYQATNNSNLSDYFKKHQSEYLPILKKIDDAENSCLKHFVAEYLSASSVSNMELENCLISGRAEASRIKEVNEELIQELSGLKKPLKRCSADYNRAHIDDCINELLTQDMDGISVDLKFYATSDEEIANINNELGDDGKCMLYVLEKLQFGGIFRDESSKRGYEACFYDLL